MEKLEVYKAITAIQGDLAKIGISKDHKNKQQGFAFRGIDDIYGAMAPLLAKYELCILPYVKERTVTERATKAGGSLNYVTVDIEYEFVGKDGSKHTIRVYGEAMDSADKATNKAMSAAYKYACLQTFCIPTKGDNDADATTHEVVPRKTDKGKGSPKTTDKKVDNTAQFLDTMTKERIRIGDKEYFKILDGMGYTKTEEITDQLQKTAFWVETQKKADKKEEK